MCISRLEDQGRSKSPGRSQSPRVCRRWAICPVAQDVGAVGELDRTGRVLLHEQDRDALLAQLVKCIENRVDHDGREAERGLVEQQQPGPGEERPRDRQLLLLPAREVACGAAVVMRQGWKALKRLFDLGAELTTASGLSRPA